MSNLITIGPYYNVSVHMHNVVFVFKKKSSKQQYYVLDEIKFL